MIKKENCEYSTIWESNPENNNYPIDWNQTLITKINFISAHIHRGTYIGEANKIIANPKKRNLFDSLEYYNRDEQIISGRYKVQFTEECESNIIYLYNDKIENKNHVFCEVTMEGDSNLLTMKPTFDSEKIEILKKKYCGYILVTTNLKYGR